MSENDFIKIHPAKIDRACEWFMDDCHEKMYSYMSNKFIFQNAFAFLGINVYDDGSWEMMDGVEDE